MDCRAGFASSQWRGKSPWTMPAHSATTLTWPNGRWPPSAP